MVKPLATRAVTEQGEARVEASWPQSGLQGGLRTAGWWTAFGLASQEGRAEDEVVVRGEQAGPLVAAQVGKAGDSCSETPE